MRLQRLCRFTVLLHLPRYSLVPWPPLTVVQLRSLITCNSLVLDKEDKKLEIAIKKMVLEKPAQAAGSQAPGNDMSELKKMVADLSKKDELSSKKVCNGLYRLLCVCGGHLSLTRPLLESLLTGLVEAGWQEVSATFGLCFGMDSASASPVSRFGLYDFSELYDLDWTLFATTCCFLCLSFLPSILLNRCLVQLVQLCCVVYELSTSSPKFNIFDYTTYPDLVVRVEQDFLFMLLSRFAPEWLLGSRRFTNRLHSNLEIEVPKMVVDTFSAGLKYLSPIAIKTSLVKESWTEFCNRALKSWARGYHEIPNDDHDRENDSDYDPFYHIPIPFKLSSHVLPFEGKPDKSIMRILQAGWRELNSLLSNVPILDRNNRSIEVESKDVLKWCFTEDVLVKSTDKNLGTALVSVT